MSQHDPATAVGSKDKITYDAKIVTLSTSAPGEMMQRDLASEYTTQQAMIQCDDQSNV